MADHGFRNGVFRADQVEVGADALGLAATNNLEILRLDRNNQNNVELVNRNNTAAETSTMVKYRLGCKLNSDGNNTSGSFALGNDLANDTSGLGTDLQNRVVLNANQYVDGINYRVTKSGGNHIWTIDTTGNNGNEVMRLTTSGLSFNSGTNNFGTFEEGTFSPGVKGSSTAGTPTYTYQVGRYQKINDEVYIHANVRWTALSGSAGNLQVSGLPYTAENTTGSEFTMGVSPSSVASNGYQVSVDIKKNSTDLTVNEHPNDGSTANAAVAHNAWYGSSATLGFTGSYTAA